MVLYQIIGFVAIALAFCFFYYLLKSDQKVLTQIRAQRKLNEAKAKKQKEPTVIHMEHPLASEDVIEWNFDRVSELFAENPSIRHIDLYIDGVEHIGKVSIFKSKS